MTFLQQKMFCTDFEKVLSRRDRLPDKTPHSHQVLQREEFSIAQTLLAGCAHQIGIRQKPVTWCINSSQKSLLYR